MTQANGGDCDCCSRTPFGYRPGAPASPCFFGPESLADSQGEPRAVRLCKVCGDQRLPAECLDERDPAGAPTGRSFYRCHEHGGGVW